MNYSGLDTTYQALGMVSPIIGVAIILAVIIFILIPILNKKVVEE